MSSSPQLVCVNDYEKKAISILDANARGYYQSGADDEQTLHDNVADFKKWRIRPKMMVDVSRVNLQTSLLGSNIAFPICIAPTASHKLAHPQGEIASALAAKAMDTCFVLSTLATTSAQSLAESVPNSLKWYQLYITKNRNIAKEMVKRAEMYGYKALVLTVDTPLLGTRRADVRNRYRLPPHLRMENFDGISALSTELNAKKKGSGLSIFTHEFFDQSVTWADIAWLKSITSLPVVVKGVLTAEDAEHAISAGVAAIIVSNHGARQLDGVSSTIMALSEVVRQVGGRVEVYVDGGVRTGTDILKALALGARAVFLGRPVLYALAVSGEQGVRDILTMLARELKLAMQLSGQTDVNDLSKDLVVHESRIARL